MRTLNEMAVKLQESIIEQQQVSARDANTLKVRRYNNLRIRMEKKYEFPHIIVTIGISEAVFDIIHWYKISGGLGSDERYVKKWVESENNLSELVDIYNALEKIIKREGLDEDSSEGWAEEVNERFFHPKSIYRKAQRPKSFKDYLKSNFKRK